MLRPLSSKLSNILNRHNPELRKNYLKLFQNPLFKPRFDLTLSQERDLAYDRLNDLSKKVNFS